MPYCTPDEIRNLTGLTVSDATDAILSGIILHATAQLNGDIQNKWEDERVSTISTEKENELDSSNTTYYVQNYPLGDKTNNGSICGADVYAYTLDSDGTRAQIVVKTVDDAEFGKLTLNTAPASDVALYFTYYSSPVNMYEPNELVKLACIQLSAALAFTKIDVRKVRSFRVGKIAVTNQSEAFNIYRRQYYQTLDRIRSKIVKVMYGEKTL